MNKEHLKRYLGTKNFLILKRFYQEIYSIPFSFNLNKLASIYQSDKWGVHYYTPHYRACFRKFKFKRIKLFEIGVGGYHSPDSGGASLRMWKRYFPFGKIYSMDIYDKSLVQEKRIKIYQGDQSNEKRLNEIISEIGEPDIIIDDGSHINEHVITSFKVLFPKLKNGGVYVIEDTQTSYWPGYGGDSENMNNPGTMMNYFKMLADSLNYKEFFIKDYSPSYFDQNIISIHFYHNLIFIYNAYSD